MPSKAKTRISRKPSDSTARHSKKRTGYVQQALRLTVADNRLIRKAAQRERLSVNAWATRVLVNAAQPTESE